MTKGSRHDVGEQSKRKRIRTRWQRAAEMIRDPGTKSENCRRDRDPDMMPESRRNNRGSRHDVGEPPKIKRIQTRCQRAAEKKEDSDMMLENR